MKKLLTALISVCACSLVFACAACSDKNDDKKPEKLKDGTTLELTEGDSAQIDLSEYISIEETDFDYSVSSSATTVATVTLSENIATVTAVAEGNATVTASADTVSVSFEITVSAKQQVTPEPEKVDKTALAAELALEITEQGDYTEESFKDYTKELQAAKTVNEKTDATQSEVDNACNLLKAAREALAVRSPEEVDGAVKTLLVIAGTPKEIAISDYIDAKNLSSVTYEITCGNELVTASEISEGKFTVTADETEENVDVALAIVVKYKGESKLTVTLTLQVKREAQPAVEQEQVTQEFDIYALENKDVLKIDFTQNIEDNGVENLVYSVISGGNAVTLDGDNCLSYNLDGNYTEAPTEIVFNVSVSYGEDKNVSYVYTLKITDTTAYRVVNGGFADGLNGWTASDGQNPVGEISEADKFWATDTFEGYPMFNVGKYFAGNEANTGTLKSSLFTVGGINKITFMLGAAGNPDCFITLENEDGDVLAIWRNVKFEDVGNWDVSQIGVTQFANNLVTYVADLNEWAGEKVRIVLNDEATRNFGFINFDELITYYASAEDLPAGAVTAENQLADKAELQTAVDGAVTVQGDYTAESYNAYAAKVAAAQEILEKVSATQAEVDAAKAAVETAFSALAVREPEEKAGADKSFSLLVGDNRQLTISDYVDGKDLSNLTYEVASAEEKISVSEIADGKFTVTAGSEEVDGAVITIDVKYKGSSVLTVSITVSVTSETAPILKAESVVKDIDLFTAENKTDVTLDFASNVENIGGLELEYAVTLNGETVTLDGTSYTYAYASYTETATEVVFAVKVSYTHNGTPAELDYEYKLNIKDTRAYRVANGGFDDGLDGWTLSNPDLGGVNADETYWADNVPFNNDGKFFNAYFFDGGGKEYAMGTLTSSPFTIGGSGWITYKLGGAKNADKVYLDIIEKDTGNILARYYNNAFSDDQSQTQVRGCTLVAYRADLSAHIGKTVYIRLSDNAVSDYGLFFADSFVTYYTEAPTDGNAATEAAHPDTIYQLYNGGFETGDLSGWELVDGEVPGKVSNLTGYWGDNNPYNKDGEWLFTGAEGQSFETDPNLEYRKGTLRSNVFTLKAGGWISFKLGGALNVEATNIKVVKADGTVLAVFHNTNPASPEGGMVQYVYNFADLAEDTECYIEIYDNAESGWGLIVADSFVTDYEGEPQLDGAVTATNKKV